MGADLSQRGYFITFEGLEGAGKSTQIARLHQFLQEQGIDVVRTYEPGGTDLAEKIRQRLLHSGKRYRPLLEALLFSIARRDHVAKRIAPALGQGKWVLCDRFIDTTRAYQGAGRGVPQALLEGLIRISIGRTYPDFTIMLDITPQDIAKRLASRGSANTFDTQAQDFFERAHERYKEIAVAEPHRVATINALEKEDVIAQKISAMLEDKVRQTRKGS